MATKIITVANQKGGVGKTTTVINVCHGLALLGKKILALDFDPQGNLASALGVKQEMGIYYLLTMGQNNKQERQFIHQTVRTTGRDNLWIIPGNQDTRGAQIDMSTRERPVSYVRQVLDLFMKYGLDYIVIDTSPSLGGLQERALWAADLVIVPTAMEYLSNQGVIKLAEILKVLDEKYRWNGKLLGILPTFYDDTTRQSRDSLNNLQEAFGDLILPIIHRATVLRESAADGQSIFEKDPDSRAAEEYQKVVKAVLRAR
ncbi:MAG: ParA family protein [Chloroflexi bacterium]|nr:ParA family protein [Chloroflexota bacterium]MBL7164209.1 ParA family protein [Anaerolineales bacterium]